MRIGLIAQPHRTGIGVQTAEFARHFRIRKVLLTDLTKLHAQNSRNGKQVSTVDWFNDYERMTVDGVPTDDQCKWLLEGIDVLFVVETPLNWAIFNYAKMMNVKTVLQYNYEFFEYFLRNVPNPDLFLAPSLWNIEKVKLYGNVKHLPVPIATDRIKRRKIGIPKKFLHVAGHKAYLDRDGTEIIKKSLPFIKNMGVEIKVHDQSRTELDNYWDLYDEGDVMLLPRRYGGLSLKLQEAAAAGIPTVVTERDPYAGNPCTIIVPGPYHYDRIKLKGDVESYSASPQKLGELITELSRTDLSEKSEQTYQWAQERSWERMQPEYMKTFEEICA